MEILVLGLSYKTAPVELREKLAVSSSGAEAFMSTLRERGVFDERVLLSTCNRTELYGVCRDGESALARAKVCLSEYSRLELSAFEDKLYVLRQPDSISHLFSVASGLDSMVVGETEIIGQVKGAYLEAHRLHQTGKVLNTLFQRSLKVAKDLRTQTQIGMGHVGVASVAVDLAQKIFEDLRGAQVMVLGTGEMASQVTKNLVSKGAHAMVISSHHHDRAESLAREIGGTAVHYGSYEDHIRQTDVFLASTTSKEALVTEKQVRGWMRLRGGKPIFIIDIAMPRNVESSVQKIDNVYLYNLDDLTQIADANRIQREGQISECLQRVGQQTQYFMNWLSKEFGAARTASS